MSIVSNKSMRLQASTVLFK